jgi:hypothetical protein
VRRTFVPRPGPATVPRMTEHRELRADRTDLLTVAGVWRARVDDLDAVRRTLESAPLGGLGPRVGPAVTHVLDGWAARAGALAGAAQAHADALWATWGAVETADDDAAHGFGRPS